MPAHIPVKQSILMLMGGLAGAIGIVFLLNFMLSGPKLGSHYDFLLNLQGPPVVSREILIIDTDEFVEGSDLFTVFMTLTEMNAANMVMTGRILPSSSPVMLTEAEIRRRFFDEYALVSANIRNLFEGIRLGTVTPVQAPLFVEHVVELTERGRDRLLSALVDRDEEMIRAAGVFGNYLEVHTEPLLDWDGRIRRVRLVDAEGAHPVFYNLRNRYVASQIENTDRGQVLWMRRYDGQEFDIPLDKDGNVITPWNCNFRRIDISYFRDYENAEFALLEALSVFDELGLFSQVLPDLTPGFEQNLFELSPLHLGEYTFTLRNELLRSPGSENSIAWREARANYIKGLDNFFNNNTVMIQINRYEEIIADTDPSNTEEIRRLIESRDRLAESYAIMREEYGRFSVLRAKLEEELMFSYCIMGPQNNTLSSALAANVMITGAHINPAHDQTVIILSIICSAIVLLVIFLLRPLLLLAFGLFLSLLSAVIFGFIFYFYSYWIDPLIVFGSSLAGTMIIFCCKHALLSFRARSFRMAYGSVVSKNFLQTLIAGGRPRLSEVNVCYAAIIAIKDVQLLTAEDREKSQDAGKVRSAFLSSVKKVIFNAGAVIVGSEGDTILACFGSPLEIQPEKGSYKWSAYAKSYNPVDKACAFVLGLLETENNAWHFGMDAGECTFYWSAETGYSVNGRPAVRARILASKAKSFKTRTLITDTIRKKLNIDGNVLGALYDKNDTFYAYSN